MGPDSLRDRITAQFSGESERADVWRVFDRFLATDAFLNLGYSAWYQPHVLGAPQRRLSSEVGRRLAAHLPTTAGVRLLDVGCGRGGPAVHLAERYGFDVTGLDLVPHNVALARAHAADRGTEAEFVVGDATRLPFERGSLGACTAIDSLSYLPDRRAAFSELSAVLETGGIVVLSDLLAAPDADAAARRTVDRFADAWDMPPPGTRPAYERALDDAGFAVLESEDISAHSVDRFRTWSGAFCRLSDSPAGGVIDRLLARWGLDPATIDEQIRLAHEALPSLRHGIVVAEKR